MKYRIKIITYKSGRQEFEAQVKKWFGWVNIMSTGDETPFVITQSKREHAMACIDAHYKIDCEYNKYDHKIKSIEFEYITK